MNGLRHGLGKFFYSDGGYYDGEWKLGKMLGLGYLFYPSGEKAYYGEWRDDMFNGQGIVWNEVPLEMEEMFDYSDFTNMGDYWVSY